MRLKTAAFAAFFALFLGTSAAFACENCPHRSQSARAADHKSCDCAKGTGEKSKDCKCPKKGVCKHAKHNHEQGDGNKDEQKTAP